MIFYLVVPDSIVSKVTNAKVRIAVGLAATSNSLQFISFLCLSTCTFDHEKCWMICIEIRPLLRTPEVVGMNLFWFTHTHTHTHTRTRTHTHTHTHTHIYIYITSGGAFRLPYSIAFSCSIRPFLVLFPSWLYVSQLSKFFGDGLVFSFLQVSS
jgi:hypothetical protein